MADRCEELSDRDDARVEGDVGAIVGEIDLDLVDSGKPIQGFLDPVGSPVSCDALGRGEAGDSNRHALFKHPDHLLHAVDRSRLDEVPS